MAPPIAKAHTLAKVVAALFSLGTAGVTIFTFARSYGLLGVRAPAVLTVGTLGVSWVSLSPAADTVSSLGDTVHLAATVTDENGTALIGATIRWTVDDSVVARVVGAGQVVARQPGTATVIATVGDKLARARVVVRQRIAGVRVNGSRALTLGEDDQLHLSARAVDARGNSIPGVHPVWRSLDTSIVTIDSTGLATARAQGTADLVSEVDGVAARTSVAVVPLPGTLDIVAGDAQRAVAGTSLARAVTVRLVSTRGQPIAGAPVRFRTSDGRGSAEPESATTDAHGVAHTSWTLSPFAGRQRLLASNERLDSVTVITAEADPSPANTRIVPLHRRLEGRAGETLTDTVVIMVMDTLGRTFAEVPVEWVAENGGRIVPVDQRTDSVGQARAIWTLGPSLGLQHVRLRVGSGHSVPALTLGAVATAGPPASIISIAGDGQKGQVTSRLAKKIVLRVVDAAGNPVPSVTLALQVTAGEIADTALATDSAGLARVAWTMPRETGVQHLTVHAIGVERTLALTAAAVPAPAANIIFAESKAEPIAGKRLGTSVSVTVTDVYGNAIEGAIVKFSTRSGTAAPATVATDDAGIARTRWTLGSKPGEQTLTASVSRARPAVRSSLTVQATKPKRR